MESNHAAVPRPISIHALREESDPVLHEPRTLSTISIHALREESDPPACSREWGLHDISIHALREESDRATRACTCGAPYFNPRSP